MKDSQIIELYWNKNPQAISASEAQYGAYCFTVANGILNNAQDSEECVNDTWLRAWNAIPPTRPAVLKVFLAKITRHLSFDKYRAGKSLKRGGGETALVLEELAEFDSCFVRINVMGGTDVGITFDDLADLANTFDFSVIASVPGLPALEPMETANAEANDEQQYIAVSREGITDQIPVETICILNTGATIAIAPEYFTHNVCDDVDVFTCEAWTGEREAYYSVYYIGQSCPNDICEELVASYGDKYASRNVHSVKIGPYDATAVLFDGETASPSHQRHFFIVPAVAGCIVIEAQFDIEMYEGLYQIMLALFDTLEIG